MLRGGPVSALVQGADRQRKLDIAMMFWVLKGANGRIILVDAGFYRPKTVHIDGLADTSSRAGRLCGFRSIRSKSPT